MDVLEPAHLHEYAQKTDSPDEAEKRPAPAPAQADQQDRRVGSRNQEIDAAVVDGFQGARPVGRRNAVQRGRCRIEAHQGCRIDAATHDSPGIPAPGRSHNQQHGTHQAECQPDPVRYCIGQFFHAQTFSHLERSPSDHSNVIFPQCVASEKKKDRGRWEVGGGRWEVGGGRWRRDAKGQSLGTSSYLLSRWPATKAATAPSSHSIRHSWMACQSSTVRALKNTLTDRAPTTQSTPARKAITAGIVSPSRSPSVASSARPGISSVRATLTARSERPTPQA